MSSEEFFRGWSDEQLREYLRENGKPAPPMANRNQLIDECVAVGHAIESQITARSQSGHSNHQVAVGVPRAGVPPPPGHYPPPMSHGPPRPMPPAGGHHRKKAMLVGINYFGTSAQLSGCINDVRCMHYLLTHRLGFHPSNILMMTDDSPNPVLRPTRANMMNGMMWLMSNLQPGDSLVFHYSGHGSQQRDYLGTEADGLNETLCPSDFRYAGEIIDDELNRILVNPLPAGVKLHAVIDACHSGSVLDLDFTATCHHGYLRWESERVPGTRGGPYKGTAGGFAVQFGASRDSQVAADTSKLSGGVPTGAATFSFIQALERRGLNISYGDLLVEMYNTLQMAGLGPSGGGGGGSLLDSMLGGLMGGASYRGQEPVMSANYAFDLNFKMEI